LIKNSQPFGKNVRKSQGGFFVSLTHCIVTRSQAVARIAGRTASQQTI